MTFLPLNADNTKAGIDQIINRQISIIKNGSFYNTDAGIEPAFFLDKPESFYDRPAFVEYLHELK